LGIGLRECGMMVGERRFELPTSASRTLRANQTALLPVFMLYCKPQRPERCALTRLRYSPFLCCIVNISVPNAAR
jgi:hypothetical protein